MPRIEMNDLMQGYSQLSAESINFIKWFYSRFDNGAAANQTIINVEPLYYMGLIAGTEFLTYAATKLYLCFELKASATSVTGTAGYYFATYDEANVVNFYSLLNFPLWNGTTNALNFVSATLDKYNNIYFSRVFNHVSILYMKFNGFRITLI